LGDDRTWFDPGKKKNMAGTQKNKQKENDSPAGILPDNGTWIQANPAENDLQARNERLEGIINSSIDGMVSLDRDLKIISWNDTAAIWSDKSATQVIGEHFFDVFPMARLTPHLENAMREALMGRKSFLPAAPGFYLPGYFETHFVSLKDASGNISGILQIMHDVAHRIKAENELKTLNSQLSIQYTALQHANEELATFAKIASHDLKEPLRKIYTFIEILKVQEAGKLSNSGRSYFRSIQKSVQRMALLTDDIANFSELNTSSEPLQRVDLSAILAQVIKSLKDEIDQAQAQIQDTLLPDITGYAAALTQLFTQLLSNALKFRKKELPLEISIRCEKIWGDAIPSKDVRQEQQYYCISFEDNGIGFEPEYSTRIFGLFQRLHPEGSYRGSGMGLAIALKAARMHDGFVRAVSTPGKGSIFCCYLPVFNS
jgi:PAS domain S-box-containing protein